MRLIWSLFFLAIPSLGLSQSMKASSKSAMPAKTEGLQWFSALPESSNSSAPNSPLLEENRQKIQDEMITSALNTKKLGTLASLQLKGSIEEQKQAVLNMLETTVARNSHAFSDFAQWAQSQGIRHPQEAQLKQLSQNMEGKMLDEQIRLAQSFPGNLKSEVIASALETGLEVVHPQILSKIMEQKNLLSPNRYASLLQNGIQNVGHLYDGERDLPAIEKAIRELQTSGVDSPSISCSIWKGLSQYDTPPDQPSTDDSYMNLSPEGQRLRGVLLKPLMEMHRNKTTCKDVPNIKALVQDLEKKKAITPQDARTLSRLAKGNLIEEQGSSDSKTYSVNCGLKEIQSELTNEINGLGDKKEKESHFTATTSFNCNIRMVTAKTNVGIRSQISLWNASGQKLLDIKKDFKDSKDLVDFLVQGKYPTPPAPKTLVLTNLPPLAPPVKSGIGTR
jgi:hypothetical protein